MRAPGERSNYSGGGGEQGDEGAARGELVEVPQLHAGAARGRGLRKGEVVARAAEGIRDLYGRTSPITVEQLEALALMARSGPM